MLDHDLNSQVHRRGFIGGIAAGAAALAVSGLTPSEAEALESSAATDEWLDLLKGKHKQYFDAVSVNGGFPLAYAMNYMNTMAETYKLSDPEINAVVGLRHFSIPIAFNDAVWQRYKLGEFFKVEDPATKAPALRNPYAYAKPGELMFPGMAVEKLQARGAIFTVCNIALTVISGLAAQAAGLPREGAKEQFLAGMFKGVHVVPSGVLAVGRAQEKGCSYCFAG